MQSSFVSRRGEFLWTWKADDEILSRQLSRSHPAMTAAGISLEISVLPAAMKFRGAHSSMISVHGDKFGKTRRSLIITLT